MAGAIFRRVLIQIPLETEARIGSGAVLAHIRQGSAPAAYTRQGTFKTLNMLQRIPAPIGGSDIKPSPRWSVGYEGFVVAGKVKASANTGFEIQKSAHSTTCRI